MPDDLRAVSQTRGGDALLVGSIARGTRTHPAVTIALCFVVALVEGFDIQAIGLAAPRLAPQLGLTSDAIGWIFAVSNVGLLFGAGAGGWLADRIGRKPVLIAAVVTFGVFTLLTAVVTTFAGLCAVRLVVGIGFGAAFPNLMAIATESSCSRTQASTTARIFCGMPIGGGLAALATQLFVMDTDWRMLFIVGGGLPLLLAPLLVVLMPETLRSDASTVRANSPAALFAAGRGPATLLLWIALFGTVLVVYLILNWLPTLAVAKGVERAVAPQAALAFNFASVPGCLLFGRLVDKFDVRWPLGIAYAGLTLALFALSEADTVGPILCLSGLVGFFLLGGNYALYGLAPRYYEPVLRGTGSGASVAAGRVGSILGPLLAGWLLGSGMSAAGVVASLMPIAAVAGCAAVALSYLGRVRVVEEVDEQILCDR